MMGEQATGDEGERPGSARPGPIPMTQQSRATRLARKLLPARLHDRIKGSAIARRLARGSLWSLAGTATSRIASLVSMVLVARTLGQERFGALGLVQSTLGVAGIMAGVGLGSTGTRFVAQYAKTDRERAGRIIALVLSVSAATIVLTAAVLVTASGPIARTALGVDDLQVPLRWGALLMAVSAFRGVQNGIFAGLESFEIIAKLSVVEAVISLGAIVLLARHLGVEGVLLGLALSSGVVWLVGAILLRLHLKACGITIRYQGCLADRRILGSYSLPSFLANLVATPTLWFAMTLVSRTESGLAGLGSYNAAYQWHGPMVFLPMILTSVSIPVLVQEWEAGNRARFRKVTLWICGLTLAISMPPVLIASLCSPWIMSLYGPEFGDAWLLLVLILAAAPLHAIAKISSSALLGMNRAWWILGCNLAWSVTLLSVIACLLPTLGVLALAIAFVAAYGVLALSVFGLVLRGSRQLSASP